MIDPESIQHVYPVDDLQEHDLSCHPVLNWTGALCFCPCNPTYQSEGEGLIVVHNSFDGREGVEWAKEILNK